MRFNDAPLAEGGCGSVHWLRLKIQTRYSSRDDRNCTGQRCAVCSKYEPSAEDLIHAEKDSRDSAKADSEDEADVAVTRNKEGFAAVSFKIEEDASKPKEPDSNSKPEKKLAMESVGQINSCGHFTHSSCLTKWKATPQAAGCELECPMCRLKLDD